MRIRRENEDKNADLIDVRKFINSSSAKEENKKDAR